MEKYGIGKQDFASLREGGFVYVDKTGYIKTLLEGAGCYFLSRPRRFGKSLFLSTLEYFFLGRRELFEGLLIDSYPWEWEEYPVIRINLGEGSYSRPQGLEERLYEIIERIERSYGVNPSGNDSRSRLSNLIYSLKELTGRKVVILIDEYEKPLLDTIYEGHHESYQKQLADFYSVLKNNEERIKLLFLTGVTRFGHLNIFSGFNNLQDISLDDEFSSICGITEEEMRRYLCSGIEKFAVVNDISFEDAFDKLKDYYDGYHFSRKLIDIYNPFSLLSCLKTARLTSQWFQSVSSRYLLDKLKKNNYDLTDMEGIKAKEETLMGVDASMNDSVTLLYQSGYLTIKEYNPQTTFYTLGIPNLEVSTSLYSIIIPYYLGTNKGSIGVETYGFVEMMEEGKAEKAMEWLQSYFSSIPYDVKLDYEREFQQVIYAFFALSGQLGRATLEKQSSDGRIDMVYETLSFVYVFEFKLGENPQSAIDQINSKQYHLQWNADGRKVYKIGVSFSSKSRGISGFIIE